MNVVQYHREAGYLLCIVLYCIVFSIWVVTTCNNGFVQNCTVKIHLIKINNSLDTLAITTN